MPKSQSSYQQLKQQLDEVMHQLEREDLDVDEALEHYQQGLQLVEEIEKYLKTAENKVSELKAKFNKPGK